LEVGCDTSEISTLSNEVYRDDVERYQSVELTVIASNDFAAEFLGERNTKTVRQGDPASRFKLSDTVPEISGHITAFDHTVGMERRYRGSCRRNSSNAYSLIIYFTKIYGVSITNGIWGRD